MEASNVSSGEESFKDSNLQEESCDASSVHLEEENLDAEANAVKQEGITSKLKEAKALHESELQQRHEKLMNLLTKSQFYTEIVFKKFRKGQEETAEVEEGKRLPKKKSRSNKENEQANEAEPSRKRKGRNFSNDLSNLAAKRPKRSSNGSSPCFPANQISQDKIGPVEKQPKLFENGTLRPYQMEGYTWLKIMFENGVNGILADEMGLGKTIQAIALLCHLIELQVSGPFLVVAPLSTLPNWIAEFRRFAPKVPLLLYHGPEKVRKEKQAEFFTEHKIKGIQVKVAPVVITSYEVVIKDTKKLNKILWRYIVVDEGHRLKNHKCQLTRSLNSFLNSARLILTGTPLQNNLAELWSLLNFLVPEIFDSLDVFESWFLIEEMMDEGSKEKIVQQEREKQVVAILHKILAPFLLRRVKADVELDIPPKRELLVYTPMTLLQIQLYTATLKRDFAFLCNRPENDVMTEYSETGRPKRNPKTKVDYSILFDNSSSEESLQKFLEAIINREDVETKKPIERKSYDNYKMQNIMMQLRKIVNHPYLVSYPLDKVGNFRVDEELLSACGKLQVLDQILKELYARGHRVLIFSQMTNMLDIIEDYLTMRPDFSYRRLDGSCTIEERTSDIKAFNEDRSIFLFLLSTRAGGLGINLSSADTVIVYDSDWNPQQDLQAQDRCHRIGQTKPVLILRLVTTSTIDQRIVERAATKRKLEKIIMKAGKFKMQQCDQGKVEVIRPEELLELLEQSDHHRVHQTSNGNVFTKEELDLLLNRSEFSLREDSRKASRNGIAGVFKILEGSPS